ncbi:MAG: hypothetical protein WC648_04715 [Candidatus Paceibacterota bacterium]|jgi:hypothetical protein
MHTHITTLERELDSLIVKSLENGNMLVEIKYKESPGIMSRLAIANEIGELIYEHIGKIRHKRDKRKKVSNVKLRGCPITEGETDK